MADNYLEFSEVIEELAPEEEAWLKEQLEIVHVIGDEEYPADGVPEGRQGQEPTFVGCRAYRDMEGYESLWDDDAGFCYTFFTDKSKGRAVSQLLIHADSNGDPEKVAHLVQKFLRKFRPARCWALSYAASCSKPRVGEFGGGALFVTASEIRWQHSHEFIDQCVREFHAALAVDPA